MEPVVLSGIYVHPIKSCRAVALDSAVISGIGLAGDRIWQVVDGDGRGLTQRQHPVMATVQPELLDGGGLRLTTPTMPAIEVSRPVERPVTVKSHFGTPVPAFDAGDVAATWFSEVTGASVRLVAMDGNCGWRLPDELDVFEQRAPFSDAAPILVTTEASLNWLRERADEDFTMDRFRPNLVVRGGQPWDEDAWATFRVGEADLRAALPWPRCAIPQVDQRTGDRRGEPAKVLRRHRWCTEAPTVPAALRRILEGSALFGSACSIGPVGTIVRVGDAVTVTTTAPPVLSMPDVDR